MLAREICILRLYLSFTAQSDTPSIASRGHRRSAANPSPEGSRGTGVPAPALSLSQLYTVIHADMHKMHGAHDGAVSVWSTTHSFGSKPAVMHSVRAVAEHAAEAWAMAGAHLPCNASNCCTVVAAAKISARRGDLGDSYTGLQPGD